MINRLRIAVSFLLLLVVSGVFALSNRASAETEPVIYLPIIFQPKPEIYKIAYVSDRAGAGIYLAAANGQDSIPLIVESGVDNDWPHWSDNGARIAFRSTDGSNKSSVRVVSNTGEGNVYITAAANFATSIQIGETLRWSPDSSELAFFTRGAVGDVDADEIFVAMTDGSGVVNITNTPDDDERFLDWSPDGESIVFANYEMVDGVEQSSIVTIRPNEQNRETLYGPIANHALHAPAFAPDGSSIAFIDVESQSGSTGKLVLIDPDGSNSRIYQPPFPLNAGLEWSPDSSQIGFIGEDNGVLHAFVVDASSGTFKKAIVPTDALSSVTWTADSSKLIFDAPNSSSGARDLYSFDAVSSSVSLIIGGDGTEMILQGAYSPIALP